MIDLTVAAIPAFFGSMEAERRYLKARAAEQGRSAADYTREDTVTSLLMGVGSIVAPLVVPRLVRNLVPGRGRFGAAVVGAAAAGAVVTTIADRLARDDAADPNVPGRLDTAGRAGRSVVTADPQPSRAWRRRIRHGASAVRKVTGPATIVTGAFAAASGLAASAQPKNQWRKGEHRDLGTGPLPWAVAIAGWDFIYYWNHRLMHEVRLLWAHHVIHHSSERYNLSTALRQPVSELFLISVPYGIMARLGIRPALIAQARGINLLYQYWIHTETIGTLGPAEEVLNTPSHHRVHHGSNPQYIDRNHGSILIIWDRLFGTFEREDEPVVYGLTKNIESYNPAVVITHEYRDILRDVANSTNWRDRLSFVFRGPGWAYERHRELEAAAQS